MGKNKEMNNFYILGSKLYSSTIQVASDQVTKSEDWISLVRGQYVGFHFPIFFSVTDGKKWCDILNTGWPCLFLISEKFKTILEQNEVTGWKVFDVKVLDKKNSEVDGYYGLSFIGRCGTYRIQKSNTIEKQMVPNGPITKYYVGYEFDINSWDNSNMFTPEESLNTFIDKKTMKLLKESKLSNVKFDSLNKIETPEFALKNSYT